MSSDPSITSACPKCGRALPPDAPQGLCVKCVFTRILGDGPPEAQPRAVAGKVALPRAFGAYELLEEVARGGMGIVYRARQTQINRVVALKVLASGHFASPDFLQRFRTEAEAVASLDHPNIVPVYEVGECEGHPFFSMKFVAGGSLAAQIANARKPFSNPRAAGLLVKLARAVHYAHQRGILHRDLKPHNVLLDGQDEPHLTDFGLAKLVERDSTLTHTMAMLGTPSYMSPEQARGEARQLTTAVDVYGLGAVLYEVLAGQPPFAGGTTMETVRQVLEKEPKPPSAIRAEVDRDLETICLKCLEKDAARRYGSAIELAEDLERWERQEPILARPSTAAERFGKWVIRNKTTFATLVSIALFLVVGLTISIGQAVRATRAEREQSRLRELAEQAQAQAETNAARFRTTAIQSRRSQYAADMFAATAATEAGSYGRARRFLREYFPRPDQEELRGLEWRYWWQLSAGRQLKTFLLSTQVLDIAWSPGGRLIAAATGERMVRFLDPDTGQLVSALTNHVDWGVSISFSHDGKALATAGTDDLVRFWNVHDGQLLFSLHYKLPRVACSPAGSLMAVGTGGDMWGQRGESVHLVDTTSGRELKVLPNSGDRAVFSPDGRRLASANWGPYYAGQAVMLWDVESGEKLHTLTNKQQVVSMAFSPDGGLLAIGTRLGEITMWNLRDLSHTILRPANREPIWSLAFSPDGPWLAVAMLTQEVEIWDTREKRQSQRLPGHTHQVRAVAFSPDGARLASGSLDNTIKLWDPRPPKIQRPIAQANLGEVGRPVFSADSRWMAAATTAGTVQIVDARSAAWEVSRALPASGYPLAFSKDASTLLTFTPKPKALQRWDALSGQLLSTIVLNVRKGSWRISAASPDGSRLALMTGSDVEICETGSGRSVDRFSASASIEQMDFSSDGQLLAMTFGDQGVVREPGAGRTVQTLEGHEGRLEAITFSPDQKQIATGSWDHTVRLWEAGTGRVLAVLTGHKAPVQCCAFSPDGRTLISGSNDRTIKFWNLVTLREVGSIQLESTPTFLKCSPDGQIVMAEVSDRENDFRCWRVPSLAEIDAAEAKEQSVR